MSGSGVSLVDTSGNVINTWVSSYTSTGRSVELTPNGDLIRSSSLPGSENPVSGENVGGVIEKFNWQGDRVGYFVYAGHNSQDGVTGLAFAQHHNILVMPNGNILMSTVQTYSPAQAIAAGINPVNVVGGTEFPVDGIVEVRPDWANNTYTEVWKWSYWNHLVQNIKPDGKTFYVNSAGQTIYQNTYSPNINTPYKLNANFNGANTPVLDRFFAHDNGLDYNAELDQIVVSARVTNEIYIIDHSTTSDEAATSSGGRQGRGGDFLYRWGDSSMYGGTNPQTLFFQHNVQWIKPGLPGAGDLIVMSNGNNRPGTEKYTTVEQWTPPVNPTGGYTLGTNGAFGPTTTTWHYEDSPRTAFYNSDGGGVQRLTNGDTMISFDTQGLAFVVSVGQINWQFQNGNAGTKGAGAVSDNILYQGDNLPVDVKLPGGYTTTFYNAPWYSNNFFTFTNQQLVGSGTIEKYRDWFEIYNPTSSSIDLSGMYLSNLLSNATMFKIPNGISIPAHGYIVFYADENQPSSADIAVGRHVSFTLNNSGGNVYLYDVDGVNLIDTISYSSMAPNTTYGSALDGTTTKISLPSPSPGGANQPTVPSGINLSTTTFDDFQPLGTTVASIMTIDSNIFEAFTYSLVPGTGSTDNVAFTIVGNTLRSAVLFDARDKNSYSIRLRSTDTSGLSIEQSFTINVAHRNQAPAIINSGLATPALPNNAVTINATVTDDEGVRDVSLVYRNNNQTTSVSPFTETFGTTTSTAAWDGVADQSWSIIADNNPFKLNSNANYNGGTGVAGLQFTAFKTTSGTLTSMPIDVTGLSASVSFWVKTSSLSAADGWAFQLDTTGTGNNFITYQSGALADGNHAFQQYTYNLTQNQLVPNLRMRFAFTGGGTVGSVQDPGNIQLDQIVVTVNSYLPPTTVPMFDDGLHGDKLAGDSLYGASISGLPLGTSISYYITAIDNLDLVGKAPASAPTTMFSYLVENNVAPTDINLSSLSVAENLPVGSTVGTLSTIDSNQGNSFTYSLVTGTGSTDNTSFAIVGNTLKANAIFNYEAKSSYSIRIRSIDQGSLFVEKALTIAIADMAEAAVASRQIFYNRSTSIAFGNGSGNPINAIDLTKVALLPGQTTTAANFTNYSRGLNGIVVDVLGPPNLAGISAASFQFATWSSFPDSTPNFVIINPTVTVSTFAGGGLNGSDRVKLEFANNAIQNAWLRVTMLADANTGLAANDVFYFGNARFDVTPTSPFPSQQVTINAFDVNTIRARQGQNPGVISNIFDVDRNGVVNAFDTNAVRAGQGCE